MGSFQGHKLPPKRRSGDWFRSFNTLQSQPIILLLLIVLVLLSADFPRRPWLHPSRTEPSSPWSRLQELNPTLEAIRNISGTAGVSIGVLHQGQHLWTRHLGFRDVKAQITADDQTQYGIGSLTKAFTTVATSQLVANGSLTWDTLIHKELGSDFKHVGSPRIESMATIIDLLSHSTGVSGDVSLSFQGDGDHLLPQDSLLPSFSILPSVSTFRSAWNYNSWGYSIVGKILEQKMEKGIDRILQENVFDPLNLSKTTTRPQFEPDGNLAEAYSSSQYGHPVPVDRMEFRDTFFEAAAGAYTNMDDMMKWTSSLLKAYENEMMSPPLSTSVLPKIRDIFAGHIPIFGPSFRERTYAIGWIRTQLPGALGLMGDNLVILQDPSAMDVLGDASEPRDSRLCWYHQGSTVGYYSAVLLFPETQSAITVLTNAIALTDSADTIAQAVAQALFDFKSTTNFVAATKKLAGIRRQQYDDMAAQVATYRRPHTHTFAMEDYTGNYSIPELPQFRLEILAHDDESLELRFQGLEKLAYPLRHWYNEYFEWSLTLDEEAVRGRYYFPFVEYFTVTFLNTNGSVSGLQWSEYTFTKLEHKS